MKDLKRNIIITCMHQMWWRFNASSLHYLHVQTKYLDSKNVPKNNVKKPQGSLGNELYPKKIL